MDQYCGLETAVLGGGKQERVVEKVRTGNGEKKECETLTMVVVVVAVVVQARWWSGVH